jgi:hypothetical protein
MFIFVCRVLMTFIIVTVFYFQPTMGISMLGKKPSRRIVSSSPTPASPPPDYPGLEYPPVFEPETYTLSDASSLLRSRQQSHSNTKQQPPQSHSSTTENWVSHWQYYWFAYTGWRRETVTFEIIRKKRRKLTKLYLILKMCSTRVEISLDNYVS